jgi:hypothetical protein
VNTEYPFGTFTEDGRKYQVRLEFRIEPAQLRATGQTIDHAPIPADALEVAICGTVWPAKRDGSRDRRYRDCAAAGQIIEELRKVGTARVQRVADLWDRWHLNGMRPNCSHMATTEYARGLTCPATGYESGTAWLYESLPADVLAELRATFGLVQR